MAVARRRDVAGIVVALARMLKRILFGLPFIGSAVQATTYTGAVQQIQTGASPTAPGNIRVSIFTGRTTICTGFPSWYSFDLPSMGLASTWVAVLLSANAAGRQISILGTGSCDGLGVETVTNVIALP